MVRPAVYSGIYPQIPDGGFFGKKSRDVRVHIRPLTFPSGARTSRFNHRARWLGCREANLSDSAISHLVSAFPHDLFCGMATAAPVVCRRSILSTSQFHHISDVRVATRPSIPLISGKQCRANSGGGASWRAIPRIKSSRMGALTKSGSPDLDSSSRKLTAFRLLPTLHRG